MSYALRIFFMLCAITALFSFARTQHNPLRSPPTDTVRQHTNKKIPQRRLRGNAFLWKHLPFGGKIVSLQRDLSGKLSRTLRTIKERPDPAAVAGLLFIAFLYGIIHSIGPGHAKALFITHGLTHATPLRSTWIAGALFAFTHTGMAMLLFIVLRKLLGLGQTESEYYSAGFTTLSGILIMAAGFIIILSPFLENAARSITGALLKKSYGLYSLAVAAGIAPCPGAFLILSFSSILGVMPVGLTAVIAVSIGMAITVSIAGMLGSTIGGAITGKRRRPVWQAIAKGVHYLGGAFIVTIGVLIVFG
ncbi:MAG: hypothetical protein JXA18_09080 [Chitinispirillaceae bacterium]|nr:hypothetical protein [Chitinispirillaceae bacterium]